MFFGWFNFGDGGVRRGGGCMFLPLLFVCGSFYMFDNLNSSWLIGLLALAALWFVFSSLTQRQPKLVDEKQKNDWMDEKPKRDDQYISHDGELLEVVDPKEDDPL